MADQIFVPQVTPTPTPVPTPKPLIDMIGGIFMEWVVPIIILVVVLVVVGLILRKVFKNRLTKKKTELLFKDFNVGKYDVKLYRKIGGKYVEIDTVKMDIAKDSGFKYNNKDFKTFNPENIGFSDKSKNYFCFDYDSGAQLTFNQRTMPDKVSIEDVDTYVNRGIIEQLVKGLEDLKPKGQWLMFICGLGLGIGIGIVIGMYI